LYLTLVKNAFLMCWGFLPQSVFSANMGELFMSKKFHTQLLRWYQKSKRDLPWRKNLNPYAIWISEIMLQQTQVKTVIPYFLRWLEKFPTVQDLAKSQIQAVLKQWEGLGYYRRAHHIHACAQKIVREHAGEFPTSVENLMELPGIGRYTAGAIASIAFGKRVPILDGNVERILCRIFGIGSDVSQSATKKQLWALAENVLPAKNVGDFNQAMMELGATVCVPIAPNCDACPVSVHCEALQKNLIESVPYNSQKIKITKRKRVALLITHGKKILLQKREHQKLLGGLWELPGFEMRAKTVSQQEISSFLKGQFNLEPVQVLKKSSSRYTITRYSIDLQAYQCEVAAIVSTHGAHWVSLAAANKLPMPGHQRKIFEHIDIFPHK
jgi:A/G-specific adenine glycosylase